MKNLFMVPSDLNSKQLLVLAICMLILNLCGYVAIIYYINWQVALALFCIMLANNLLQRE